jgi:hypothetical protein
MKISKTKVVLGYDPICTTNNQFSFPDPKGKDFEAIRAQRATTPDYNQEGEYFEGVINAKKVQSYIDASRTHLFVEVNGSVRHYQISKQYSTTSRSWMPLNIPVYEKALPEWVKASL